VVTKRFTGRRGDKKVEVPHRAESVPNVASIPYGHVTFLFNALGSRTRGRCGRLRNGVVVVQGSAALAFC